MQIKYYYYYHNHYHYHYYYYYYIKPHFTIYGVTKTSAASQCQW